MIEIEGAFQGYPIPSDNQIAEWRKAYVSTLSSREEIDFDKYVAEQAAKWAADTQLDACVKVVEAIRPHGGKAFTPEQMATWDALSYAADVMREYCRPLSPKENALQILQKACDDGRLSSDEYISITDVILSVPDQS